MKPSITISQLQQTAAGKLAANEMLFDEVKKLSPKLKAKTQEPAKGLLHIKMVLWMMKIDFIEEFTFHSTRKWRFDIAIKEHKIGIEFEGIFSDKSRHTSKMGYSGDCDKYNGAAVEGYRVLRYTASNYKQFYNDIKTMLEL